LKALLAKYESLTTELPVRRRSLIGRSKRPNVLLRETNKEIEKTIRHIRETRQRRRRHKGAEEFARTLQKSNNTGCSGKKRKSANG
jgi:DNA mismatch repair protein MutS2